MEHHAHSCTPDLLSHIQRRLTAVLNFASSLNLLRNSNYTPHLQKCCKPYHTGAVASPNVEATIRARFSAILKKDISYLLKTSHPDLHSFMYGSEPGQALRQLQDDLWNTGALLT